jgi:hypothetical protein
MRRHYVVKPGASLEQLPHSWQVAELDVVG